MKKMIGILLLICLITVLPVLASAQEDAAIKQSSTGDEVALIQARLRDLGYLNYRPTGKFSDMTAEAVKKFQMQSGIARAGRQRDLSGVVFRRRETGADESIGQKGIRPGIFRLRPAKRRAFVLGRCRSIAPGRYFLFRAGP